MKRRAFLVASGAALAAMQARGQSFQPAQDITPMIEKITAGAPIEHAGVEVVLPQLAENGNSVPLHIRVPSPMSAADHVIAVHVIAERNPRPLVAVFRFGEQAGRAEIDTRVRLAGTQKVTVIAALSGNRFRMAQVEVLVTSAACLDEASMST